jgi:hypothetical protein
MVGVVATALAWVAHVWAGGDRPEPSLLLLGASGVTVASVVLSRYRWAPASLMLTLLAGQVLLHRLFDQGGASAAPHQPGHLAADGSDGSMTVAHVLAAAATAWVLARGEDWLWLLLELMALRATRLLRARPPAVATGAKAAIAAYTLPSQRAGLGAWSLRGPPVTSK